MTIRTLLVDDERLARADLRRLLAAHADVEVVGEADSVAGAMRLIARDHPDLIFLDIQMPGESGFDLLERMDLKARVVFVTAFDAYAIRAFEVDAADYLLKPVHPDRLASALARVRRAERSEGHPGERLCPEDSILLPINGHLKFVRIHTILCINAAGDYSELITVEGKKGLVQKTMAEWEHRLPASHFCRIHRSTIVNIGHIRAIDERPAGASRVFLQGTDVPLTMSRRYASALKRARR